jgi:predicted ArsR family transcriptional regulator
LRLLQIKSCNIDQITDILGTSEDKIKQELEELRKNEFVLMSPQRQEEKLIKIYEILPEGIQEIDKTDTQGFNKSNFRKVTLNGGIIEIINQIQNEIQKSNITEHDKNKIIEKVKDLKNRLEI